MKRNCLGIIALGLIIIVGGFLLIQLVPYGRKHTDPPVIHEPNWDSPQTRILAKRACFDCHSNQSTWPWYSNVAPISWLIQRDVDEGRAKLNFSNWHGVRRTRELSEVVLEGSMPPATYLLTHPQARISNAERQQLAAGLVATASNP